MIIIDLIRAESEDILSWFKKEQISIELDLLLDYISLKFKLFNDIFEIF